MEEKNLFIDDYYLGLLNSKKYAFLKVYFEKIIYLSDEAKVVSYDFGWEKTMSKNTDPDYHQYLNNLIDSYVNNDFSKEPGVFFLEFYKDSKKMLQFDAESQIAYVSEKFENKRLELLHDILSKTSEFNRIYSKIVNFSLKKRNEIISAIDDLIKILNVNFTDERAIDLQKYYDKKIIDVFNELGYEKFRTDDYFEIMYFCLLTKISDDIVGNLRL